MAVIPLPDNAIVNVQFFGKLNGQEIITLFQYKYNGATSGTTDYFSYLDALEAKLVTALNLEARYLALLPANWAYDFLRIQPVYPTRLRFKDYARTGGGSWVSEASTSNIAASVERFGRQNKRRGVGRVQIPVPDGVYTAGVITDAGYKAELAIFCVQAEARVSTTGTGTIGDWDPVIHATNNAIALTTLVEGYEYKTTVRTMHRRTVGLGI